MLKIAVDKVSRNAALEIFSIELPIESLSYRDRKHLRNKVITIPEDNLERLLEQARILLK